MAIRLSTLVLLVAVLGVSLSSVVPRIKRNLVRGRPVNGFLQKPLVEHPKERVAVPTKYFQNKVDHFSSNTATYSQRYWVNDQWYKPGGPVFFMLGGEAPEDASWVESPALEWTTFAQEHGAYVVLAEHRYYGNSRPTKDMSTANLVYLSSAQALEDFASLITYLKSSTPSIANAKWVTFGGSYSGALAAWLRLKHPELIFAAVGSSGPVQAEVDFVEYLEVVKNSITNFNAACGASVTSGFNQVAQLLQTASGRASLRKTFNLCEDIDITNANMVKTFWETVYSPYMEIVQYSWDNAGVFRNSLNIDHAICRFHLNNNTAIMNRMQSVNTYFNVEFGYFGCNDISYDNFISFMQDTTYGQAADSRAWVWQTCTEFGYYQSTDSAVAGPWFGGVSNLPVDYYVNECTAIYGSAYNSASVAAAIAKTNSYYGGRDQFNSTQVLFPNGIVDPWHALGKLQSSDPTLIPVIIQGTAHCADMYPAASDDFASLTAARTTIRQTLDQWLPVN